MLGSEKMVNAVTVPEKVQAPAEKRMGGQRPAPKPFLPGEVIEID